MNLADHATHLKDLVSRRDGGLTHPQNLRDYVDVLKGERQLRTVISILVK